MGKTKSRELSRFRKGSHDMCRVATARQPIHTGCLVNMMLQCSQPLPGQHHVPSSCPRLLLAAQPQSAVRSPPQPGCLLSVAVCLAGLHVRRAGRRAHLRDSCRCRFRSGAAPESAPNSTSAWTRTSILLAAAWPVVLLGLLTGPSGSLGSLIVDMDVFIHQLTTALSPEDHQFFGVVSNRLDDVAQSVAVLVAVASSIVLLADGGFPWVFSSAAGLESIRFLQRLLKDVFHRSRPTALFTDFSYPSAHTARFAFCVALVFCVLLPKLAKKSTERFASTEMWFTAAILSWILMGSLRVLADAHWPSDTLGGACLGISVAALSDVLWSQLVFLIADAKCWICAQILPLIKPEARTVGVHHSVVSNLKTMQTKAHRSHRTCGCLQL